MSEVGVWPPLGIGGRGAVGAGPVCAPRVIDVDVVVGVVAFATAGWRLEGNVVSQHLVVLLRIYDNDEEFSHTYTVYKCFNKT